MGQIIHICGPDATLEYWFATSDVDPPHNFTEGEIELVQRWSVTYPKECSWSVVQLGLAPVLPLWSVIFSN